MMKPFGYVRCESVEEACHHLSAHPSDAAVLAGGTDLIPLMRAGSLRPRMVLDIKGIPGLSGVRAENGRLLVGALATMAEVGEADLRAGGRALTQGANDVGSVLTRNRAALGGNICRASPSGDTLPALLVLDARFHLAGPSGRRVIPADAFFVGPGQTAREPGELLTGIEIPAPHPASASVYLKYAVRAWMDLAIVGVAAYWEPDPASGRCRAVRIALGAVAPTPIRARAAEGILQGSPPTPEAIRAGAEAAAGEAKPITDVRGSADYRRKIVRVLVRRALEGLVTQP